MPIHRTFIYLPKNSARGSLYDISLIIHTDLLWLPYIQIIIYKDYFIYGLLYIRITIYTDYYIYEITIYTDLRQWEIFLQFKWLVTEHHIYKLYWVSLITLLRNNACRSFINLAVQFYIYGNNTIFMHFITILIL